MSEDDKESLLNSISRFTRMALPKVADLPPVSDKDFIDLRSQLKILSSAYKKMSDKDRALFVNKLSDRLSSIDDKEIQAILDKVGEKK